MTSGDQWRWPAAALSAAFADGTLTPSAYLEHLLGRIERINPRINALVRMNPSARADAAESTRRLREGNARGPLEGVPVAVKDNILVRGMPTTWGSRAFARRFDDVDELAVERLRAGGALIIGKTNVPEFTLEGYTDNLLFGVTRNPWDPALTPGGSSGGSVAGVAAGLFPLAIGTDGGGSIRRPASHTGLVALKPSIGAIPRTVALPQILLDFEVIGPIARTVEDAALLFGTMAGPDPRDHASLVGRGSRVLRDQPRSLRILYVPTFGNHPLDSEIGSSVRGAAEVLSGLGHRVDVGALPFSLDAIVEFWPVLGQVGVAHVFDLYPEAEAQAAPKFVDMARQGRAVPASRYLQGLETIRKFRHEVASAFDEYDLIMTPSAAALPWAATEAYPTTIAGSTVGPRGHAVYTGWVNACGHPAINLPSAPSRDGLPIGFQLVARHGDDALLLEVGARYETEFPFAQRFPRIAFESRDR